MKITDSKNDVYYSCPYINNIQRNISEVIEILHKVKDTDLEAVRKINAELRERSDNLEDREIANEVRNALSHWELKHQGAGETISNMRDRIDDLEREVKELEGIIEKLKS